jgi:hypothetical protein
MASEQAEREARRLISDNGGALVLGHDEGVLAEALDRARAEGRLAALDEAARVADARAKAAYRRAEDFPQNSLVHGERGHEAECVAEAIRALAATLDPEPKETHDMTTATKLDPAGAVYGLLAWLTTCEEQTVLSSSDDAAPAARIAKDFCEANGLGEPDSTYPDALVFPEPEET